MMISVCSTGRIALQNNNDYRSKLVSIGHEIDQCERKRPNGSTQTALLVRCQPRLVLTFGRKRLARVSFGSIQIRPPGEMLRKRLAMLAPRRITRITRITPPVCRFLFPVSNQSATLHLPFLSTTEPVFFLFESLIRIQFDSTSRSLVFCNRSLSTCSCDITLCSP